MVGWGYTEYMYVYRGWCLCYWYWCVICGFSYGCCHVLQLSVMHVCVVMLLVTRGCYYRRLLSVDGVVMVLFLVYRVMLLIRGMLVVLLILHRTLLFVVLLLLVSLVRMCVCVW